MNKIANVTALGLAALAALLLAPAVVPLAASAGIAGLCIVAAVTWMAAVRGLLPGRDAERRVPVRADRPHRRPAPRRRG